MLTDTQREVKREQGTGNRNGGWRDQKPSPATEGSVSGEGGRAKRGRKRSFPPAVSLICVLFPGRTTSSGFPGTMQAFSGKSTFPLKGKAAFGAVTLSSPNQYLSNRISKQCGGNLPPHCCVTPAPPSRPWRLQTVPVGRPPRGDCPGNRGRRRWGCRPGSRSAVPAGRRSPGSRW